MILLLNHLQWKRPRIDVPSMPHSTITAVQDEKM